MPKRLSTLLAALTLGILTSSAGAQSNGASGAADRSGPAAGNTLSLELNRVAQIDKACRVGFVTQNGIGEDLERAAFEIVLFNPEGLIERLLVLDFGSIPEGRTKVREFNLANTDCASVDRVLLNEVSACEGDGLDPAACSGVLSVQSRADVEFGL